MHPGLRGLEKKMLKESAGVGGGGGERGEEGDSLKGEGKRSPLWV